MTDELYYKVINKHTFRHGFISSAEDLVPRYRQFETEDLCKQTFAVVQVQNGAAAVAAQRVSITCGCYCCPSPTLGPHSRFCRNVKVCISLFLCAIFGSDSLT